MPIPLSTISRKKNGSKFISGERTNPFGAASDYPKFNVAWNNLTAGAGLATIGFIGDSTTQGVCSSGFLGSARPNELAWPTYFSERMKETFGLKNSEFMFVPTAIDSNDCWTVGAGWIKTGINAGLPPTLECPVGVSTSIKWSDISANPFDSVTVYFVTATGGGTFNATLTGGSSVQGSCLGTSTFNIGSIVVNAPQLSNFNELTITTADSSKHIWIIGVKTADSKLKTLCIGNLGVGGSKSQTWTGGLSGLPYSKIASSIGATVTFISLGINEHTADPVGAGYLTRIQTLANTVSAYSDVVLLSPFLVGPTNTTTVANLAIMSSALTAITGVSKYINVYDLELSKNMPWFSTSTIHTTALGNKIIADIIFDEMTK